MIRALRPAACLVLALAVPAGAKPAREPAHAAVVAKPPSWTQKQKSSKERGGNPCNTPDPGFGAYLPWSRDVSMGQVLVPKRRRGRLGYDVMVHFHGHEPARKEWVRVANGAVLVGIDLGLGSGPYESAFARPGALDALLASVARTLQKRDPGTRVRHVGLSAWSAGYGAIQGILADPRGRDRVDSVVLLDGLHCGYVGRTLNRAQLRPFIAFAELAARGERLMVVTHSSIIPPGYASTTETANYLVQTLGGRPQRARARASDPLGLELISRYNRGGFHVRGFSGNDTLDHCAHLGLYRDILKVHVLPRWNVGRGSR